MSMQQQVHLQHQQAAQNQHQSQQVHQQQGIDVQQIDYNNHLAGASVHGHHQVMHQQHDYLSVSQMGSAQNYAAQSPNSYGTTVPMTSVIQHRMSGNHSNLTAHNPLPSPHQRLGPSPSSCSVGSSYYGQSPNVPPGKRICFDSHD